MSDSAMDENNAIKQERITALVKELARLKRDRDILSAQRIRQERIADNQRAILKTIHQELQQEILARTSIEDAFNQSRANLQLLCDVAEDFIFLKDSDRRIIFCNKIMQRTYGKAGLSPLGNRPEDFFPPAEAEKIRILEERVLAGETISSEQDMKIGDKAFFIHAIKAPVRNEKGEVVGICCISRDITERKQMEEELRKTNERLQGILDHSISVIYIKDLQGRFELVNPKFLKVTGLTQEYLLGRHARYTLTPDEIQSVEEEERKILTTGIGSTRERQLTVKDGPRIYITTKFPLYDAQGQITSICTIDTDITETKRLEAEATRAAHLAAIGELAAGVAHEINNPINGVINYAQILLDELGTDDPKAKLVKRILHESDRVAELVRNLLSFARNSKRTMSKVHLADVVNEALNLVGGNLCSEQIEVTIDLPEDLPPLWANFSCVQQILVNLLLNAQYAIKQSSNGNPGKIHILASLLKDSGAQKIVFSVQDTGAGMDENTLSNIFNPFFTTKPRGEGTGLGLYICYQLIQEQHGTISVDSVPGQGTTFTVAIPAADMNSQ